MLRDVEVYCWTERVENIQEKSGNRVRQSKEYHYTTKWLPAKSYVDSRNFKDQKYNLNVAPDIQEERLANSAVRVGMYYSVNVESLIQGFGTTRLINLFKHGTVTAEFDRNGIWAYDSKNGHLTREKNPGKSTVGDVRVSYRVIKGFEDIGTKEVWASVCGIPHGNQITSWSNVKQLVMPGKVSKSTFL